MATPLVAVEPEVDVIAADPETMIVKEPYRFVFKGYSIWLELQQADRDLEKAISMTALDNALYPIPEPHCTVLYGISNMSEAEAKRCFREKVAPAVQEWPALETSGSHVGVAYDGVDGEEMDMAWMELTLKSSPQHEAMVDKVHSCFYNEDEQPRLGPWQPHVSIAYDNPEASPLDKLCAEKIMAQYPSLLETKMREVVSISLWRTEGRLWDWACLDRVLLSQNDDSN